MGCQIFFRGQKKRCYHAVVNSLFSSSRNAAYVKEIIRKVKPKIFCLQEHWLHEHDRADIEEMLEGRKFVFKAVDVSEEQGNRAASCSRGGVLTCWSKELDELVIPREGDSTDRVLVTCFNLDRPICIVNCYLASGDTKEAYERYCDDLDIITNMIIKYEESHDVIIIGQGHIVLRFICDAALFIGRRAHHKGIGANQHHIKANAGTKGHAFVADRTEIAS